MTIKIVYQTEVCWDWNQKTNTGTYLDLIVFDRGDGLEVIRTARKNWQECLEQGKLKTAKVPDHLSLENISAIIYEKEYLLPLIG
jgi:hypothetical protein